MPEFSRLTTGSQDTAHARSWRVCYLAGQGGVLSVEETEARPSLPLSLGYACASRTSCSENDRVEPLVPLMPLIPQSPWMFKGGWKEDLGLHCAQASRGGGSSTG